MESGVFVGKSNEGNFDLLSMGDYINPLTAAFKLKDLRKTISQDHQLYLIVSDTKVEYIKLEILGKLTFIRMYLSKDKEHWSNKLEWHEVIDATNNNIITIPIWVRVACDDFIEYYSLTGESIFKEYKFKLIYI